MKRERSSGVGGGLIDLTEETDEDEDEDEDDDEDGMEVEAGQAIAQAQGPDLGGLGGVRLMAIPGGPADEEEALYLAALEERDELSDRTKKLQLPPNPLDEIMDRLGGPDKVAGNTLSHIHTPVLYTSPSHNFQTIFLTPLINAPLMSRSFSFLFFLLIFLRAELTGRKDRLVRQKNGTFRLVSRSANGVSLDKQNMLEKKLFMKDKKQVAIISDAASTGISLQADRRVKNQRQRVHITFELAWSADKAIQQMGRTHRANQSSAPEYHLLISPQGGEKRFASAVARRLESLGALTQGDRSAVGARTMSVSVYNLESAYGTKALKNVYTKIFYSARALAASNLNSDQAAVQPDLPNELRGDVLNALALDLSLANKIAFMIPRHTAANPVTEITENDITFSIAARVWLKAVGIDEEDFSNPTGRKGKTALVAKFLNRILGLESVKQNLLYQCFHDTHEHVVRIAKRVGTYDSGVLNIKGTVFSSPTPPPSYPSNDKTNLFYLSLIIFRSDGVFQRRTDRRIHPAPFRTLSK